MDDSTVVGQCCFLGCIVCTKVFFFVINTDRCKELFPHFVYSTIPSGVCIFSFLFGLATRSWDGPWDLWITVSPYTTVVAPVLVFFEGAMVFQRVVLVSYLDMSVSTIVNSFPVDGWTGRWVRGWIMGYERDISVYQVYDLRDISSRMMKKKKKKNRI